VPFYFINLLRTSLLYISILLVGGTCRWGGLPSASSYNPKFTLSISSSERRQSSGVELVARRASVARVCAWWVSSVSWCLMCAWWVRSVSWCVLCRLCDLFFVNILQVPTSDRRKIGARRFDYDPERNRTAYDWAQKNQKKIKPSRPGGGHGKPLNFHKSSGRPGDSQRTNLKSEVSVCLRRLGVPPRPPKRDSSWRALKNDCLWFLVVDIILNIRQYKRQGAYILNGMKKTLCVLLNH